jgi:hypothetical protein
MTLRSFGPSGKVRVFLYEFAFNGGCLLANRRRVSRMEFCGEGFISCMFGLMGCPYCVEISILDKASQKNAAALRMDNLRIDGFIDVRVSEIAWGLGEALTGIVDVSTEVDEL